MMISAADYDPSREGFADHERRQKDRVTTADKAVADGVGEPLPSEAMPEPVPEEDEWEEVEIEEEEEDDDVDMFAAFGDEEKPKKKRKVTVRRRKQGGGAAEIIPVEVIKKPSVAALEVVDNVDDTEGYYRITPGEILDGGRYQVTINLGKGMFSGVVKAKVLKAVDQERRQDVVGKEVAIKVIRSQESM
jgi:serine/threonine-protein kinase PRP4